jgi:uncharacterized protein (TIGR00251 family)
MDLKLEKFKKILAEKNEVYLQIKVHPQSGNNLIREVMADETIKIDIAAPAEKGRANKELIGFLAKEFDVSIGSVKIISGAGDRVKLIKIIV